VSNTSTSSGSDFGRVLMVPLRVFKAIRAIMAEKRL
jgi:hypothetical protein